MSYTSTSNAPTVSLRSHTDAFFSARNTRGTASQPPDILTYRCGSQMVYVTPGEEYDRAIEIAVESFPELRDVERDRISLEVHVHMQRSPQGTVKIGRTAWPFVVATLARFEIVEVCVAPPPRFVPASSPHDPETGRHGYSENAQTNFVAYRAQMPAPLPGFVLASSSSDVELPPYELETGRPEYSENAQTNFVAYRAQIPSSPQPHSRVVDVVPSWPSQGRHSPQLR